MPYLNDDQIRELLAERATLTARIAELEQQLAASNSLVQATELALRTTIDDLKELLAQAQAGRYVPVDTIELDWGYQIACVEEHPDGEITLQTTGYSIADPDLQFSIRMPKQYRLCRWQEGSEA